MDYLVMSPEPFIQKCKSLAKAKNTYLIVVGGRVRLAWAASFSDGCTDFMDRAEVIGLGISYDMLLEALSEAEGSIDALTISTLYQACRNYHLILPRNCISDYYNIH